MLALYTQNLDPLHLPIASTAVAALPVLILFTVLVPLRKPAPLAALSGGSYDIQSHSGRETIS